jgi:hypothetical protein
MVSPSLSLRERLIVAGLLRPADPDEKSTAHQRLRRLSPDHGVYRHSCPLNFDTQLTLAVLERWYTL